MKLLVNNQRLARRSHLMVGCEANQKAAGSTWADALRHVFETTGVDQTGAGRPVADSGSSAISCNARDGNNIHDGCDAESADATQKLLCH
jgi:hypothetical protein